MNYENGCDFYVMLLHTLLDYVWFNEKNKHKHFYV